MKKIELYKINWNLVNTIRHDTFGEGKIQSIFNKVIGGIQIPFVAIKFKDFECLYIAGEWEKFYETYSSISVNVTIGRKLTHFKYGEGVIKNVSFDNNKPIVIIKFNCGEKKFSPANMTSEYFDEDTLPIFNNTYKEPCYFTESGLYLTDARGIGKNHITFTSDIFLYRVVTGGGRRGYDYLTFEQNKNFIEVFIDKGKNNQVNVFYDPYPRPKLVQVSDSKGPSIIGAGDVIWNNQQRYKEVKNSYMVDSEDKEYIKEYSINYSRSEHTGWFYSDKD